MENQTALKYYQSIQKYIRLGDGSEYVFVPRANISLAWVSNEHVDQILNIKKGCCGGKKKSTFFYANESDIRRWTNGGGR